MNRFFRFLLGTKPTAGMYYTNQHTHMLLPEDIGDKYVRIRYAHLTDDILTYREFHFTYGSLGKQRHFK